MKISSLGAALVCVFLAGPASASPSPCSLTYVAEAAISLVHNQISVQAGLGDRVVPLVLDTGAAIGMLSHETAMAANLHATRTVGSLLSNTYMRGVGGDRPVSVMLAPHARLGDVAIADLRFAVPTSPRTDHAGHDIDLLGMNALATFDMDIDLLGHRLVLFQGNDQCSAPRVLMGGPLYVVPMVGPVRDLHTEIEISLGGHRLTAYVDTGATYTAISTAAAARVGLNADNPADEKHGKIRGAGAATVDAVRRLAAPMQLGDLTVSNMHVLVVDQEMFGADMLLGMDVLSKVHTWISNSTRKVVFQVPPTASPRVPGAGR